jgi:hypothetical protein
MQTMGVHLRDPAALLHDLGPMRSAAVAATFVGGIVGPMIWPVATIVVLGDLLNGSLLGPEGLLRIIRSTLGVSLVGLGVVAMLVPIVLGARRQGLLSSLWYLPLLPAWHVLLFIAGWSALLELFKDPFAWAKTDHGRARRRQHISAL